MAYLEMNDVSFVYPNGQSALEHVSMHFDRGERVAIIGQNGAGKTTAAKLLNGLNWPTEGNVVVGGWNTRDYSTAKIAKRVGYVFQNPDDQIFNNRVYDEIAFGPKNLGYTEEEVENLANEAADLVQITEILEENPYDLPLSMRKFVTTASIIAMDPEVLILDEPTAGQDLRGLQTLSNAIQVLSRKEKIVITITHDMEFVAQNFNRSIVMAHRNKIADGSTNDIFWMDEILEEAGVNAPHISRLAKNLGISERVLQSSDLVRYLSR